MLVLNKLNVSKTPNVSPEADNESLISSSSTVLVFKTTVKSSENVEKIKPHLESVPAIKDWSVDRNDCDHVLRVTGRDLKPQQIIAVLTEQGFSCEVLA